MKQRRITPILLGIAILTLILDSRTAISAASDAIDLCIRVAVPSLLPFFVLMSLLTSSLTESINGLLRPIGRICGLPQGSEGLFLTGLLGGYPTGARSVAQAYRQKRLSKDDATRMLAFCNNAGPAFIFGMVGQQFANWWIPWLIWSVQILSALLTGIALRKPEKSVSHAITQESISITQALKSSIQAMTMVCGWIIMFRILIEYLNKWFLHLLPATAHILLVGLLELVNGCHQLSTVINVGLRFILACGMLSLGGLCVAMQTASVTEDLGIKQYLIGKALQCGICFVVAYLLQLLFPKEMRFTLPSTVSTVLPVSLAITAIILREFEKRCSIPGEIVVY